MPRKGRAGTASVAGKKKTVPKKKKNEDDELSAMFEPVKDSGSSAEEMSVDEEEEETPKGKSSMNGKQSKTSSGKKSTNQRAMKKQTQNDKKASTGKANSTSKSKKGETNEALQPFETPPPKKETSKSPKGKSPASRTLEPRRLENDLEPAEDQKDNKKRKAPAKNSKSSTPVTPAQKKLKTTDAGITPPQMVITPPTTPTEPTSPAPASTPSPDSLGVPFKRPLPPNASSRGRGRGLRLASPQTSPGTSPQTSPRTPKSPKSPATSKSSPPPVYAAGAALPQQLLNKSPKEKLTDEVKIVAHFLPILIFDSKERRELMLKEQDELSSFFKDLGTLYCISLEWQLMFLILVDQDILTEEPQPRTKWIVQVTSYLFHYSLVSSRSSITQPQYKSPTKKYAASLVKSYHQHAKGFLIFKSLSS